jgi:predicted nuclease of predicted toxin-antitoxin system
MLFLIDEQLPPGLCKTFLAAGCEAEHVLHLNLGGASDDNIWHLAIKREAVLVTKDSDFAEMARLRHPAPRILWIRFGNATNDVLNAALSGKIGAVKQAYAAGERIVELR